MIAMSKSQIFVSPKIFMQKRMIDSRIVAYPGTHLKPSKAFIKIEKAKTNEK